MYSEDVIDYVRKRTAGEKHVQAPRASISTPETGGETIEEPARDVRCRVIFVQEAEAERARQSVQRKRE